MGERDKARPPKIHASLAEKRRRPEAVLEHIGEGDDVIVGMHNSEPATVLNAMEANADRSFGVRAHQMFPAASVVTCTGSSPGSATSPGSSRRPSGRLFARGPATWYPTTHREREHHGHAQAHPPEQGRRDQHPGRGRLYEFVRENPGVEYWPVDQTNNERAIAGEKSFVAVNATMEVDFPGQCASESLGGSYWSSSGGQPDFARGALFSEDGQSFIVLHSTTADESVSRITAQLHPGAAVTTFKNIVDRVMTEYGVAELRGSSIRERARRLIAVAHPNFREELKQKAREINYL
jgi:acyl-CoA hydrolase